VVWTNFSFSADIYAAPSGYFCELAYSIPLEAVMVNGEKPYNYLLFCSFSNQLGSVLRKLATAPLSLFLNSELVRAGNNFGTIQILSVT
jgi:hypothetical protein